VRAIAAILALLAVAWTGTSLTDSLGQDDDVGTPVNGVDTAGPAHGAGSTIADTDHLCASDTNNDDAGELGNLLYLTNDRCIPDRTVHPGDLRLAAFTDRPAGEFVDRDDRDAQERQSIGPISDVRLLALDENGDGQASPSEHLYLAPSEAANETGAPVDALRLTSAQGGPGRYVDAGDTDTSTNATLVPTEGRILQTADEAGHLYLRLNDDDAPNVQPGDLRLSDRQPRSMGTTTEGRAPVLAAGQAFVGLALATITGWAAVLPERTHRSLLDGYDINLSDTRTLLGVLAHLVFGTIVFAGTVLSTARGFSALRRTGRHPAESSVLSGDAIVISLLISLVLFVLAAVTWLVLVRDKSPRECVRDLRLDLVDLPVGLVAGILTTLAILVVLGGVNFALQQLGVQPSNPQADAISNALSPVSAIAVALLAATGEEVYFRGFLLPRTGNAVQGVLFGLIHASYLTPMQVLLPLVFGLVLGYLTRKTSLWAAIASHASFNAIMLLGAIYADELATIVQAVP